MSGHFHLAADEVHVRENAKHFHLDWHAEFVVRFEGALAGRDVDLAVDHADIDHRSRRRLVGEIEAEAGLLDFGLAAGMQVQLHDEVGAFFPRHRNAVGQRHGIAAGRPGGEAAGKEDARNIEAAFVAGQRVSLVELSWIGAEVSGAQGVMDDAAVAGAVFEGLDVLAFGHGERQDEVAIDIGAFGGNVEGLGHGDDDVRRSELPAVVEFWGGGQIASVAFQRALLDPAGDEPDFVV
jgi:hypothetical protein